MNCEQTDRYGTTPNNLFTETRGEDRFLHEYNNRHTSLFNQLFNVEKVIVKHPLSQEDPLSRDSQNIQINQNLKYFHRISELPTELFVEILSYLNLASLARCCLVSKNWKQLASDSTLWKKVINRERAFRRPGYWLSEHSKIDL